MASDQLLYFFVLTSLLFLFIFPCHSSDNTVAKVPFLVKSQLVNVFKIDLVSIVNMRLVPWGNDRLKPNKTITCQDYANFEAHKGKSACRFPPNSSVKHTSEARDFKSVATTEEPTQPKKPPKKPPNLPPWRPQPQPPSFPEPQGEEIKP